MAIATHLMMIFIARRYSVLWNTTKLMGEQTYSENLQTVRCRKKVRCRMQIVIDIPDEIYNKMRRGEALYPADANVVIFAIETGTPLPKGHGRILDEKDILDTETNDGGWYDLVDMPEYIAGVKAIIEADKVESEG